MERLVGERYMQKRGQDRWMMDGWAMDGRRMDKWVKAWMNGQVDEQMDLGIRRWIVELMKEWMEKEEWKDRGKDS